MKTGDKVWVWNNKEKEYAVKRLFLLDLHNGYCLCVSEAYKKEYLGGKAYNFARWDNFSLKNPDIKEERFMTREEVLLDNLNNPRRFVKVDNNAWLPSSQHDFGYPIKDYSYIDIPEDYEGDFSDLEVKKYKVVE